MGKSSTEKTEKRNERAWHGMWRERRRTKTCQYATGSPSVRHIDMQRDHPSEIAVTSTHRKAKRPCSEARETNRLTER